MYHAINLQRSLPEHRPPYRGGDPPPHRRPALARQPRPGGRAEFEAAYRACRAWLEEASAVYGLRIPSLRIRSLILIKHPYGCYVPANNTIHLPKFSVTTLAHEFRHAYQHQTGCPNGDEEDARGWSVSLIYLADPAFYRRAVERGLLLYW